MPVLGKRTLRLLSAVLAFPRPRDLNPDINVEALRAEVIKALHPKRSAKASNKRRREKYALRREEVQKLRDAVMARAGGFCEACFMTFPLEMDHFFGGRNRRSAESVFTCWALCRKCHHSKTKLEPDRAHWVKVFEAHLVRQSLKAEQEFGVRSQYRSVIGSLTVWKLNGWYKKRFAGRAIL